MVGFVFYLYYLDPVNYVKLITEDHWGENATTVEYGLCSLLLIWLSFQPVPRLQKVMFFVNGLGAFFVAGEEISWGQRIFGFSTPELLRQHNRQGELTLHNLDAFIYAFGYGHKTAARLIVGWLLLSLVVAVGFPRHRDKIQQMGVPLIPVQLFPIFLLPSLYYHFRDQFVVLRWDEIVELFLCIAMAAWALDLFLRHRWVRYSKGLPAVGIMVGMFLLVVVTSVSLTQMSLGSLRWYVNYAAVFSYPRLKMFDQARKVYEYIYANPQYIMDDTRLHYGRMLLEVGKREEAIKILRQAAEIPVEDGSILPCMSCRGVEKSTEPQAKHWLRKGIIHLLLGQVNQADTSFDKSTKSYQEQFVSRPHPQQDALILWWGAKTLMARGNVSAAVEMAQDARAKAASVPLRELDRWLRCAKVSIFIGRLKKLYTDGYISPKQLKKVIKILDRGQWYCPLWVEFPTRSF